MRNAAGLADRGVFGASVPQDTVKWQHCNMHFYRPDGNSVEEIERELHAN
jgi:hypothetical protein